MPTKIPVLFVGHGSPMIALEENKFTEGFRQVAAEIPKADAIICISAHWETRGTYVTAMEHPKTIHDFGGFPRELYEVQYPAPGSPQLAQEVIDSLRNHSAEPDYRWGLDHGAWTVLKHLYPNADIPVIQLSLDFSKTPQYHYELAQELKSLREKGVLIIGSGNMVHNLRMVAWDKLSEPEYGFEWALEMNDIFKNKISNGFHKELIQYEKLHKAATLAIPTPDHYYPLLYILALQTDNDKVEFFNDKAVGGSLTMTSVKIG